MRADELGLVGTTVDRLRFDACVEIGGFGFVYRAFDLPRGVPVAVKCMRIPPSARSNAELAASLEGRFQDESRLLAKLSSGHPDIVRCHGSGTLVAPGTGERTPYMVLEWLEGRSLASELKERQARGAQPYTLAEALALLDSAVSALAYAHAQEVVHRDVKPANVFLAATSAGTRAKMLDFGIAKILSDDVVGVKPSVETAVGTQFCSPAYGAPEQFSPNRGPVGPATDVYTLALVVLEMLLGRRVRPATSLAEGAVAALDPGRGSPRASALGLALPAPVEEVLARAVAQDPRARPRDAGAFWSALREAARAPAPKLALGGTVLMREPASPALMAHTLPLAPKAPEPARAPSPLAASVLGVPPPVLPAAAAPVAPAPVAPPPPRPWLLPLAVTLLGTVVGAVIFAALFALSRR